MYIREIDNASRLKEWAATGTWQDAENYYNFNLRVEVVV